MGRFVFQSPSQDEPEPGVADERCHPVMMSVGIKQNDGSARLEDAEETDNQIQATVTTESDQNLWAHPD